MTSAAVLNPSNKQAVVCSTGDGIWRSRFFFSSRRRHTRLQGDRSSDVCSSDLGDRDLATHLHRTRLLDEGRTLTEVTAKIARDLGVNHPILPMSDEAVRTRVLGPDGWLSFQEYFVREKTQVEVAKVDYAGAPAAAPAPGVVAAITAADTVIVCPSNPITSIGPILAV